MKNHCGILEHDYGCNCIGVATNNTCGTIQLLKNSCSEEQAKWFMEVLSAKPNQQPTISRRERRANERKNKKK